VLASNAIECCYQCLQVFYQRGDFATRVRCSHHDPFRASFQTRYRILKWQLAVDGYRPRVEPVPRVLLCMRPCRKYELREAEYEREVESGHRCDHALKRPLLSTDSQLPPGYKIVSGGS